MAPVPAMQALFLPPPPSPPLPPQVLVGGEFGGVIVSESVTLTAVDEIAEHGPGAFDMSGGELGNMVLLLRDGAGGGTIPNEGLG